MTAEMMALRSMLEKGTDSDVLREMIGFAAECLMELKVRGLTGAAPGERSAERLAQRNDYRAATAIGKPGPGRWNCASPSYAKAHISPAFSNPAAWIPAAGVNPARIACFSLGIMR